LHYESVKCLFRVRVNKIESTRDLDGNLGKRIELLEEREINPYIVRPQTDEMKMAQDIMQALQQQMPFLPQRTQMATPKIILFLTEQEYDSLGINFDVNQIYEVVLENQAIRFMKV
jgi:Asp-tRNA(Asn)/Glu-tRNA(Gln) amidotransferase B subunit